MTAPEKFMREKAMQKVTRKTVRLPIIVEADLNNVIAVMKRKHLGAEEALATCLKTCYGVLTLDRKDEDWLADARKFMEVLKYM